MRNERELGFVELLVLIGVLLLAVGTFLCFWSSSSNRYKVMRAVGMKPELTRDIYYLNENTAFMDTQNEFSDKINLKAYYVRKEVAGDYSKYKDTVEFITEQDGFLLFNPIVKTSHLS